MLRDFCKKKNENISETFFCWLEAHRTGSNLLHRFLDGHGGWVEARTKRHLREHRPVGSHHFPGLLRSRQPLPSGKELSFHLRQRLTDQKKIAKIWDKFKSLCRAKSKHKKATQSLNKNESNRLRLPHFLFCTCAQLFRP